MKREEVTKLTAEFDQLTSFERLLDAIDDAVTDYDPVDALTEVLNARNMARIVGPGLIDATAKDLVARIRDAVEQRCRETATSLGFEWLRPVAVDDDSDDDEVCDDGCAAEAAAA